MSKFIIQGQAKLSGEVKVGGSKNAAFPVIAASLLTRQDTEITNVPDISDVWNMLEILKFLGARVEFKNHRIRINAKNLRSKRLPDGLVGKFRGSILFAGALLGRFRQASLALPGGDAIGARPIDVHLSGFEKLGASVAAKQNLNLVAQRLIGVKIVLGVSSVTGTENLILASVLARGVTRITPAAMEPHVQNLCRFLKKMGAKIEGVGTPNLKITGVASLRGVSHRLCSDEIETITFAVAAAATKSHIRIANIDPENLDAPLAVLERMRVRYRLGRSAMEILKPNAPYEGTRIITGVFPQLLTDEQPLLGVLATQSRGVTSIHDWIYEGRQGYLKALQKMGARVTYSDVHRANVYGPANLHGVQIKTPDLRAGASILIAGLIAKGPTVLYNAEIIDRGYERLDERLNSLGAKIQREN